MNDGNNNISFPENYDRNTLALKKKLVRKYSVNDDFTALDISENAHNIYDWLSAHDVGNPNGSSVDFFEYAAQTLGIPYQVLTEAYFTQTQLSEEELFKQSTKFNPELIKNKHTKDNPSKIDVPDFKQEIEEYFKDKQINELLKQMTVPGTNYSKSNLKRYNINWLLSEIVKSVWEHSTLNATPKEQENIKLYFRKYFYKDKNHYTEQFLSLIEGKIKDQIFEENKQIYEKNSELIELLNNEKNDLSAINKYIVQSYNSLKDLSNYKRFLGQLSHAQYLLPQNIFLLMGQYPDFTVIKSALDWKYCEQEIKGDAQPIFLLGDDNKSLMPYFDFKDTYGEMRIQNQTLNTNELINELKNKFDININFSKYLGDVNHKSLDAHTLLVSSELNESYTFQELIVGSTGKIYGNLSQFELASIDYCILKSYGIDYYDFDKAYHSSSLKDLNMRDSLLKIQSSIENFHKQISSDKVIDKREVEFETFENEIKISREMEGNALANMQTVKQEKTENKNKKSSKSITDIGDLIDLELAKSNKPSEDEEDNK